MTRLEKLCFERERIGEQLGELGLSITHDLDHPNIWLDDLDRLRKWLYEVTSEIEHLKGEARASDR
jgi:hypothetical protein